MVEGERGRLREGAEGGGRKSEREGWSGKRGGREGCMAERVWEFLCLYACGEGALDADLRALEGHWTGRLV